MEYPEEYMRDYLLGKLPPEEAKRLEQNLDEDPELAEALELQRDILLAIQSRFDEELLEKLRDTHQQQPGKIRSVSSRVLWQWASAAALLLGSLGVYLYMSQTSPEERIFMAYFEDYPNIIAPVQRDTPGTEGFSAYQNGQYQEALEIFERQEQGDSLGAYPSFYKGICAMHLEDWSTAIQSFEKVRSTGDQRFEEAAAWYVSLAYLRAGNRERAELILQSIADTGSDYRSDAQALLRDLD